MSDYMSKSYGKSGGNGGGRASVPTSVNSPMSSPASGGAWKPTQSSPTFSRVTPWAGGTNGPGKPKKSGM